MIVTDIMTQYKVFVVADSGQIIETVFKNLMDAVNCRRLIEIIAENKIDSAADVYITHNVKHTDIMTVEVDAVKATFEFTGDLASREVVKMLKNLFQNVYEN